MRKFNIAAFSGLSVGLTFYGMLIPTYYTQLLISSSGLYLLSRILIAAFMMAYALTPKVRTYYAQTLLGTIGAAMLLFGALTFVSPDFFGRLTTYIPILDTLLLIEGGILALLLSLELPARRSTFMDKNIAFLATIMAAQPKKFQKLTRSQS